MIIKPRLKLHKIREMATVLARDKKDKKNPEHFENGMKEHGWHLLVSACFELDDMEKKLAKEVKLREMADAKIRSLEKKG